jgi:periplasmic divalent cation tolerance protein
MTDFIVVFVTVSSRDEGKKIASALLEERLVACVNIIPSINSIYRWQGKICDDEEILLIIKTRSELFGKLQEKVKSLHSYKVPEIIALPIIFGSQSYLDWIKEETGTDN